MSSEALNGINGFVEVVSDLSTIKFGASSISGQIGVFQRLPDDSVGTAVVSFVGVNAGSEIRVYLPDGSEAAGIETCATDQALSWPAYSPGSPNNTVRVVIVHPAFKIKEFTYTASVGAQNLPIQQELDKWYSNP